MNLYQLLSEAMLRSENPGDLEIFIRDRNGNKARTRVSEFACDPDTGMTTGIILDGRWEADNNG